MLKLLSDENFNNDIVRGLQRQQPNLDLARVQDVGLSATDDPDILAWAAQEGRLVLTHDQSTMPGFAYQRVLAGEPMPGVIVVNDRASIGQAINDILVLAECSLEDEWHGQVVYVPL